GPLPSEVIDVMPGTFRRTDGDIAATLRTLFLSRQLTGLPAPKFKDPMRYVLSAVRLAYDGRTITNTRPLLDWLNALGETPFGRATPDGYPLTGPGWESPGQMSRRFEIARAIGSGNVHLFDAEDTGAATTNRFPQLSNRLYYEAIEPFLAANTRSALDHARSPQQWNTFLLASPVMIYEQFDEPAPLDADWALAPALRESVGVLHQQRQVAFVPFAETPDLSRSHFETQDGLELGQPLGGTRDYRSGFLARLHSTLTSQGPAASAAIAFTDGLPVALQGPDHIPNISLRQVGKPPFDDRQARIISAMYAGHPLEPAVTSGLELRREVAQAMQTLADEMRSSGRDALSIKGFELEAERIARLMRDEYRIGFVDVGGWDTHVNEGATHEALAAGTTFHDRDYPVLNDFRAVLGGLFRSLWTLTPAQCAQIFPQVTPVDLQLV